MTKDEQSIAGRVTGQVTEFGLPGIGERYDLHTTEGWQVTVVIHHSGRRDLYLMTGSESQAVVALSDAQARRLGAILAGAYFSPVLVDEVDEVDEVDGPDAPAPPGP